MEPERIGGSDDCLDDLRWMHPRRVGRRTGEHHDPAEAAPLSLHEPERVHCEQGGIERGEPQGGRNELIPEWVDRVNGQRCRDTQLDRGRVIAEYDRAHLDRPRDRPDRCGTGVLPGLHADCQRLRIRRARTEHPHRSELTVRIGRASGLFDSTICAGNRPVDDGARHRSAARIHCLKGDGRREGAARRADDEGIHRAHAANDEHATRSHRVPKAPHETRQGPDQHRPAYRAHASLTSVDCLTYVARSHDPNR